MYSNTSIEIEEIIFSLIITLNFLRHIGLSCYRKQDKYLFVLLGQFWSFECGP